MRSNLGRACAVAAAAGLLTLLVPTTAFASWWDGGYQPARRHQPPPNQPPEQQPPPEQPPSQQPAPEQPPSNDCCYQRPPAQSHAPEQPAPPVLPSIYGCENSDIPGTRPVLHKETTPPEGTAVQPGDEIVVEITWRVTDWIGPDLHKALDCVYVNNRYMPQLSGGERPTPNDGHFAYHYVVPADVPAGSTICDQGFVSGPNGEEEYGREISNLVCFPVGPPPVSRPPVETTTTTGLPTAAQPQRFEQEVLPATQVVTPPAPLLQSRQVLPRTGGDSNPARLAAGALALAFLGRTGTRRRARRRRS